ncbi:hypothetical protein [Oceanibaculum nanhaiense]|uniref:hypothetical protein n=1 Tax=Oceanibaculum nanhaiense TaxID=1909734 RepID=UPI00396D89CF
MTGVEPGQTAAAAAKANVTTATVTTRPSARERALAPVDIRDCQRDRLDLPFVEQFSLWAMRLWVDGRRGQPVEYALEGAFRRLHQPQALRRLELFMLSLAHGAIRPIRLWPACSRPVSDDESRLLDLLRYSQAGEQFAPALLCRSFLRPAAAAVTARLGHDLAAQLAEAGLHFPLSGPVQHEASHV